MSEKYLFLCAYGCGDIDLEDMKHCKDPEDPTLVCPKCGKCGWFITPNDKEIANDHEQREFEVDTDRTAEWESYKRRQMIK